MTALHAAFPGALTAPLREDAPGVMVGSFCFAPDFAGFAGHFPGQPVLPGIVQIMAATWVAGRGRPLRLRRIRQCKFLRPVFPGETLVVRTQCLPGADPDEELMVQAVLSVEGERSAVMTFAAALPGKH